MLKLKLALVVGRLYLYTRWTDNTPECKDNTIMGPTLLGDRLHIILPLNLSSYLHTHNEVQCVLGMTQRT